MTLDLGSAELTELLSLAARWVGDFYDSAQERPILPVAAAGAAHADDAAHAPRPPRQPTPPARLLADCFEVLDDSRHNGSPRFLGYIASPATPVGAVADLIASTFNANVASARGARGPARVERTVIGWLGSLFGFGDQAAGLFTSGGSIGNLQALFIASRAVAGDALGETGLRGGPPLTLYLTDETHHSVAKAADVLGLGRASVRRVPCDDTQRMDPEALAAMVAADRAAGRLPFCVVGTAGTTSTGAVDPLADIAEVAARFGLWFHVDGAYGAPATLDERARPLFAGIDRADSLTVDAHKWLYTAIDCGCLLLRDPDAARRAFGASSDADYISAGDEAALPFFDQGIELTRRFRALKLWLTLRYYGVDRIAEAIGHDLAMARRLGGLVRESERLELLAPVRLGVCCFRYLPAEPGHDLDAINRRLLAALVDSGEAYLSNATVRGAFALRACVTNYRTTPADIDRVVTAALRLGADLTG
jgi:glutamate/tyrosine decarboxylase-like PLP-dependent enzyme